MKPTEVPGWDRLRHGGLLLDPARLRAVAEQQPAVLSPYLARELRRRVTTGATDAADVSAFVAFVLEEVCGFGHETGSWQRGSQIGSQWGRRALTGETIKPRQLWQGAFGGTLPVFIDAGARVGIGRGRKAASHVLQWLRAGRERLALLSNGRQWRLIFAGLDFDAWCEWDVELWLEEGELSPQVEALRTLLQPALWARPEGDARPRLEQAILDSRKGQADLSAVLGERVREAVELLVQAHGELLSERCGDVPPAEIYRAAVRVVMRMVVVLFAESRELLPRDNALYHGSYGLSGLIEELDKAAARGGSRLGRSYSAWPRLLSLFRLVEQGSHHPELPVPAYGGELFGAGDPESADDLTRALAVFETGCFDRELLSDREAHRILELLTRTRVKVRQGRSALWVATAVDFSDLSSEYIGILYEGLLDYELRTAPPGDPVVFLAIGNSPALPLSRLEAMDDRELTALLEKMNDSSGDADGDEAATEEAGYEDVGDDAVVDLGDAPEFDDADATVVDDDEDLQCDDAEDDHDLTRTTRTRAEKWAHDAVLAGKLVKAPRGALTLEKRLAHGEAIARKARQLVDRVVLPGEWYLVRWGGTRKGSGTFYTRPGLAVPTVQRTLRPLAYEPPKKPDGSPDHEAAPTLWIPKLPEEILALKVCDPACGSGTFPVAALRYLTEALYEALILHDRVSASPEANGSVACLLGPPDGATAGEERLGDELLPSRPDDPDLEPRLKAVLRRHVVERCIYGVDLDPLAVELCRLSLWIETMDRTLPFSFLDHKVKCGNALVGAWFDTFRHYPVMAFKNREGGDKGHSNGVHFAKDARTKAIKAFTKDALTPDLRDFLVGQIRTQDQAELADEAAAVHDGALATLARLHDLPVQNAGERARIYRDELLGSPAYRQLKGAMDLWCACWFWPADRLSEAPLPTTLAAPFEPTRALVERLSTKMRFFHWELEFPDVFRAHGPGFDAVLGNPPWETLQPNSKEYFSNIDPLYRAYGKQEALRSQTTYFADEVAEHDWLDFNAGFACYSNWMKCAAGPFGDPDDKAAGGDRFAIARGRENDSFHALWREARAKSRSYAEAQHPFRHRGEGKAYTYKLFLEQAHALLRLGGRLGFIVPSGLYSDHGSGGLRELFLDHCRWEWLFGFENRDKVFDIDSRFKFNPVIFAKGGRTAAIHTAFMRRAIEDWERAEELAVPYAREQVERFSPRSRAILEIQSARDLEILEKVYANSVLLGDDGPEGWGVKYAQGDFNMTSDSKLFPPRPSWEDSGYRQMGAGVWTGEDGSRALPLLQGAMLWQFDPAAAEYAGGGGHAVQWRGLGWTEKSYGPQYLIAESDVAKRVESVWSWRIAYRYLGNSTNQRTFAAAPIRGVGCGHTLGVFRSMNADIYGLLVLIAAFDSFAFDWVLRQRLGGSGGVTALDPSKIVEAPVPRRARPWHRAAGLFAARLTFASVAFWDAWLVLGLAGTRRVKPLWAVTGTERLRIRCMLDAVMAASYGLSQQDLKRVLLDCDQPSHLISQRGFAQKLDQKGFWRIDKEKDPELRHTVLTVVAFHDLDEKIRACGGDRDAGIDAYLGQNDGEGWMLSETLRLVDYGLGHDERAEQPQPVASRLGPRFYDWQLTQSAEESWRECHLHARNLLGEQGYAELLEGLRNKPRDRGPATVPVGHQPPQGSLPQGSLFE